MPNHVHMLLHYTGTEKNLNTLVGNGKRFMAYEMLRALEKRGEQALLQKLEHEVQYKDREKGQRHCFWKDSFEVKECRTEKFLLQKLHYIHNNPLSGKWKLAPSCRDYPHSSALFYFEGRQRFFDVTHYEKLLNWEEMYG